MPRILIVDDEAVNRELLHAYLGDLGHELVDAADGEAAVAAAEQAAPDLVLCDVLMPGLNGFEVTRRLKAAAPDAFLPIVLLTSLSDSGSRLLGLRAGADDFLVKPIDRLELLARVSNLLNLRRKELALVQRNVELLELQRHRDETSAMIVHDLKNPMSVILANLAYLEADGDRLGVEQKEALQDAALAGRRLQRMLANLLDLTLLEISRVDLRRQHAGLDGLLRPLVTQRAFLARSRDVAIDVQIDDSIALDLDADLLVRAIENLLDNAIRYTPAGGRIEVRGEAHGDRVSIRVGNSGPPIPAEARDRIFDKFVQLDRGSARGTFGLGLYFCKLVAEAHGGAICVEETAPLPTVFHISLPLERRRSIAESR